jgi:hypothetical protein
MNHRTILTAQLAAAITRRYILTGRFLSLKSKLAHARSEIARRRFGPWGEGETQALVSQVLEPP